MGIFRFSNAVSKIGKFIETYATLYHELKSVENFTHDNARDVLIHHGLVSSSGAIGKEAVKRSERADRSRDRLYNQVKMYSEIYRMLGWYQPGTKKSNFNFTPFAQYVSNSSDEYRRKHFAFSALHIVSPNPLVEIRGKNRLRPLPMILELMERCGGVITRDEIIIAVLNCQDDRSVGYLDEAESLIHSIRGNSKKVEEAIQKIKVLYGLESDDTLKNYTRFPLGALKWMKWATPKRNSDIYDKPTKAYHLTESGKEVLQDIRSRIDIRRSDLDDFSDRHLKLFAFIMQYRNMETIGYSLPSDLEILIQRYENDIHDSLSSIGITDTSKVLFSSIQEIQPEILRQANQLDNNHEKA